MGSIAQLMNSDRPVPDVSTLSRRRAGLKIQHHPRRSDGPIRPIVGTTGLKIQGGIGGNAKKHGTPKHHKTWRKLHPAFNPDTGDIVRYELTTGHVGTGWRRSAQGGDETALPNLPGEINADIDRFLADGADDGEVFQRF